MFPSPINGVSFKPMKSKSYMYQTINTKFPSPISGVSFKLPVKKRLEDTEIDKFPSPISGVSFKHNYVKRQRIIQYW